MKWTLKLCVLISAIICGQQVMAQKPDALIGNVPICTKIADYPAGKYLQRTLFRQPCDSTGPAREIDWIFAGIGRAYYGPEGSLLFYEKGYGGTPRKRIPADQAIQLSRTGQWILLENGRNEWRPLTDVDSAGIRMVSWKASSLGAESALQVFTVDGGCHRLEWEDKWLEAKPETR